MGKNDQSNVIMQKGIVLFDFYKYVFFVMITILLFVIFYIPRLELFGFSSLFGIQIITTIFLLSDMYYIPIVGDTISSVVIFLALFMLLVGMTIVIYSMAILKERYAIKGLSLKPMLKENTNKRRFLDLFKIFYVLEYFLILFTAILYFLTIQLRVPSITKGGYSFMEGVAMFSKGGLGFCSIIVGGILIYYASLFASMSNAEIIAI